ncbi:DNA/RNA non-specific endonuclease [Acetobacter conturbans]|uniref:DNA/RNA non-specific endonuclease n=1 Tax=Acetobacter conturbans TaxID=1737472 RepID=A0ABX0JZP9_9PROT|nr:DNA/RNA non-specific endonuclease [Acetobacter conturbans]NHN88826.1 DNA/RNA non-specific endonuclease [Acetobacter conturbans]
MLLFIRLLSLVLLLAPLAAHASCADHFAAQAQPTSSRQLIFLCSSSFAIGYSPQDREAAWSAEHLTADIINEADSLKGRSDFQEDLRLPLNARSELYDYKRSGWSRGHLTPSGDAPTSPSRSETFMLSNIVPQAARLNSGAWNHIEARVRKLALRQKNIYVMTGPAFRESHGTIGPDHVRVPSSIWKAVYVPTMTAVSVIVCKNTAPYRCNSVSLDSLERVTGIDPFPGLSSAERSRSKILDHSLLF